MQKSLSVARPGLNIDAGIPGLCALILAGGAAWVLIPYVVYEAPPLDVVESLMWGREWLLTSYKHPALPSWALEMGWLATGSALWSPYLVSQIFIAATYLLVYRLGRELMSPAKALAGTLLLAGLSYFTWVTPEFNHNLAQMPIWAAVMLVFWRAVEHNRLGTWLLLGVLAGGGFYAKFSHIVVLAVCGLWMLADGKARSRWRSPGPWLAIIVAIALIVPLVRALAAVEFQPFTYLSDRSNDAPPRLAEFVAVIVFEHGLLFALAFAVGIRPWRRSASALAEPAAGVPDLPPDRARAAAFLVLMALGPFLLTAFGGVFGLVRAKWFVPMFNLSGLLVVFASGLEPDGALLKRLTAGAIAIAVSTAVLGGLENVVIRSFALEPTRTDWPQAKIADTFFDIWDSATDHKPLKVVSGDKWIAGLVGIVATDAPSLLTDLALQTSPWITPERIAREGMLVVCQTETSVVAAACKSVHAHFPGGTRSFSYSTNPAAKPIVIDFTIVPPGTPVEEIRAALQ